MVKPRRHHAKPAGRHAPRKVEFACRFTLWFGGAGMLIGFFDEVIAGGNMLWMTCGGVLGGLTGALCDTAIFFHRRRSVRRTAKPSSRRT